MATLEEAEKEQLQKGRTADNILIALELYNSIVGSLYFVNNPTSIVATLETGDSVTFAAHNFTVDWPQQDSNSVPEVKLNLDTINPNVLQFCKACVVIKEGTELRLREYRNGNFLNPTTTDPWSFVVNDIPMTDTQAQIKASFADLKNRTFPSHLFTRSRFPGL